LTPRRPVGALRRFEAAKKDATNIERVPLLAADLARSLDLIVSTFARDLPPEPPPQFVYGGRLELRTRMASRGAMRHERSLF
jgi:hypothetical protein